MSLLQQWHAEYGSKGRWYLVGKHWHVSVAEALRHPLRTARHIIACMRYPYD